MILDLRRVSRQNKPSSPDIQTPLVGSISRWILASGSVYNRVEEIVLSGRYDTPDTPDTSDTPHSKADVAIPGTRICARWPNSKPEFTPQRQFLELKLAIFRDVPLRLAVFH